MIYLEHLVYGKPSSPPTFVLGRTENQERIKLRWYPKKEFLGIWPRNERFAKRDSKWLMGYLPAQDGAVDLVAAIPMESVGICEEKNHIAKRKVPSLDEMLMNAEHKKKF